MTYQLIDSQEQIRILENNYYELVAKCKLQEKEILELKEKAEKQQTNNIDSDSIQISRGKAISKEDIQDEINQALDEDRERIIEYMKEMIKSYSKRSKAFKQSRVKEFFKCVFFRIENPEYVSSFNKT